MSAPPPDAAAPDAAAPGGQEPLGSAAEEATRLVQALQGWWGQHSGPHPQQHAAPPSSPSSSPPAAPGCSSSPEPGRPGPAASEPCRSCPWCRARTLLQGVSPEVVDHLVAAATSLAAALRELTAPAARPEDRADRQPPPAAPERTVTIPVTSDDEDEEPPG